MKEIFPYLGGVCGIIGMIFSCIVLYKNKKNNK